MVGIQSLLAGRMKKDIWCRMSCSGQPWGRSRDKTDKFPALKGLTFRRETGNTILIRQNHNNLSNLPIITQLLSGGTEIFFTQRN